MQQSKLNHRLSSLDSTFLYLERKEAPLHIGSTSIFDGRITAKALKEHILARLHVLPRYQQRVVPDPFGIAHPTWEFVEKFDIDSHVFEIKTPKNFSRSDLIKLMGETMTPVMDREKPLWELYVITNVEGGRSAMIAKIHHAMVDGISGVDLMKILYDISPEGAPPPPIKPFAKKEPITDPTRQFFDSLLGSFEEGMNRFMEMQGGLLYLAKSLTDKKGTENLTAIAEMLPAVAAPTAILPFNGACSGEKKLAWSEFSFKDARKIKNEFGGTVNDVVLTVLSEAVGRYSTEKGVRVEDKVVRFMVPVSLRQKEQRGSLGNLISVLPVEVPLKFSTLRKRFEFVHKKTAAMKETRLAEGLLTLGAAYSLLPAPLQSAFGHVVETPIAPFNLVATNVPGPQIPLYLQGKKLAAHYPFVPIGYGLGLGCAIFSYNKELYFGLSSDAKAMQGVERFKEILDSTFADLLDEANETANNLRSAIA